MSKLEDEDGVDGPFEAAMERLPVSALPIRDKRRPDNLEVRKALLARVATGELTFEQAKKEVRRLKRKGVRL